MIPGGKPAPPVESAILSCQLVEREGRGAGAGEPAEPPTPTSPGSDGSLLAPTSARRCWSPAPVAASGDTPMPAGSGSPAMRSPDGRRISARALCRNAHLGTGDRWTRRYKALAKSSNMVIIFTSGLAGGTHVVDPSVRWLLPVRGERRAGRGGAGRWMWWKAPAGPRCRAGDHCFKRCGSPGWSGRGVSRCGGIAIRR